MGRACRRAWVRVRVEVGAWVRAWAWACGGVDWVPNVYNTRTRDMYSSTNIALGLDSTALFFISTSFIIFALLAPAPSLRNSDPGSHSRHTSPLPTTVRAYISIATRVQYCLPSSTRVELCIHI